MLMSLAAGTRAGSGLGAANGGASPAVTASRAQAPKAGKNGKSWPRRAVERRCHHERLLDAGGEPRHRSGAEVLPTPSAENAGRHVQPSDLGEDHGTAVTAARPAASPRARPDGLNERGDQRRRSMAQRLGADGGDGFVDAGEHRGEAGAGGSAATNVPDERLPSSGILTASGVGPAGRPRRWRQARPASRSPRAASPTRAISKPSARQCERLSGDRRRGASPRGSSAAMRSVTRTAR